MPVAIQMSLQFQETSYLTKNTPGDPSAASTDKQANQILENQLNPEFRQ
jgi:hypothetical protein